MNTTIYLGSVKWNNKYTHVVDFQTGTKRRAWFMNNFIEHAKTTKLLDREQGELETDILTYNEMLERGYNYMYVEEFDERVDKTFKWFAFITALERTNKDTVVIKYEIDYWQTYFFKPNGDKATTDILDAFVKREHQDRWRKSGGLYYPIWSRTIEGVEVGDMVVKSQETIPYVVYDNNNNPIDPSDFTITPFLVFFDYELRKNTTELQGWLNDRINGYIPPITPLLVCKFSGYKSQNKNFYYRVDNGGTKKLYDLDNFKGVLALDDMGTGNTMNNFKISSEKVYAIHKVNYLPFNFKMIEDGNNIELMVMGNDTTLTPRQYDMGKMLVMGGKMPYALQINKLNLKANNPAHSFTQIVETFSSFISKNNLASPRFEPKLYTQEFNISKVSNLKSEVLNILNENINANCKLYIENSLDLWNYEQIKLENYNDKDYFNRLRTKNNNELTLINEPYLNYMINNRNQIAVSQTLGTASTAIGVASIVGGTTMIATGAGLGMGLGLIAGGVHQTTSGLGGIASELARQSDYKNKVDEVKGTQNTLMLDSIDNGDYYKITNYTIRDTFKERVYELFKKQGYLANEYKKPILDSRYYYNYIQCSYVEINPEAISQDAVRRIIENIYLNGTTIWHYRNDNDFKLLDYRYENWEVYLLP